MQKFLQIEIPLFFNEIILILFLFLTFIFLIPSKTINILYLNMLVCSGSVASHAIYSEYRLAVLLVFNILLAVNND